MSILIFLSGIVAIISIYVMITLSLDLQFSYGNLINFGMVGYVAVGAYTYAIVTQLPPTSVDDYAFGFGAPMWVGLLAAVVVGLIFGVITGWPALRLRGDYFALTTFAVAEVVQSVLVNSKPLSNGLLGLMVQRPFQTALLPDYQTFAFALLIVVLTAVVYLLIRRIVGSPFGKLVLAVSDDETGALAVGKSVSRTRMQTFVLGAGIAGLAGGLYAMYVTLLVPSLFVAELTFTVWIALVLGGVRNRYGAVLGVAVLIGFQEATAFLNVSPEQTAFISSLRLSLTGLLMVIVLMIRPPKNVAAGQAILKRRRARVKVGV